MWKSANSTFLPQSMHFARILSDNVSILGGAFPTLATPPLRCDTGAVLQLQVLSTFWLESIDRDEMNFHGSISPFSQTTRGIDQVFFVLQHSHWPYGVPSVAYKTAHAAFGTKRTPLTEKQGKMVPLNPKNQHNWHATNNDSFEANSSIKKRTSSRMIGSQWPSLHYQIDLQQKEEKIWALTKTVFVPL